MEAKKVQQPLVSAEEQARREKIAQKVQASEALEGYAPLSPEDGLAYELQQQWIKGEITIEENIARLKAHHGID